MTSIEVRNYIIHRENVAYVKTHPEQGEYKNRVVVVFSGHCSDLIMNCETHEEAKELALDIMVSSKLVV